MLNLKVQAKECFHLEKAERTKEKKKLGMMINSKVEKNKGAVRNVWKDRVLLIVYFVKNAIIIHGWTKIRKK
jgi:hypothetical protein